MNNANIPAFPSNFDESELPPRWGFGLTKRELIAAMAMQGMLADEDVVDLLKVASSSVIMADALIAELAK